MKKIGGIGLVLIGCLLCTILLIYLIYSTIFKQLSDKYEIEALSSALRKEELVSRFDKEQLKLCEEGLDYCQNYVGDLHNALIHCEQRKGFCVDIDGGL